MSRKKRTAADAWRKERQDPYLKKKMELLGEGGTIVSVVLSLGFMFLHTWPWLVGCILSLLAIVVLAVMFPDYFTLIEEKKGETKCGISLDLALAVDAIAMVTGQWYTLDIWWQPIPWAVAITAAVVALLARFSRDFQTAGSAALAVVCTFVLSCFLVCQMNAYLDFSQPEHRQVTVTELYSSSHRRGRTYTCYVDLDGEEMQFDIPRRIYSQLEPGDVVCVDAHKGALGIAFWAVHLMEE